MTAAQAMGTLLTVNSGSSSLKASLFLPDGSRRNFRYEHIGHGVPHDHAEAFDALIHELDGVVPDAVGHRFVHGGEITDAARVLDDAELARLAAITHLAPLHMPGNLLGVTLCRERFRCLQVACFDTAFHATLPELARRLPLPRELGFRRYGFHGLNYAHVARCLPALLGDAALGRIAVAHLGSGASLCLLENLRSVDTTMGHTPAGGIPMGTRPGDLDPGVMLELAGSHSAAQLSDLVFHRSGLLALSDGENDEMATLLASRTDAARFAVSFFCRQVRAAIGAFAAKAGGLDALVFTAGIGEHSAAVREQICSPLRFLGFQLDPSANQRHATWLSTEDSKPVLMIPADEEAMARDLAMEVVRENATATI
jgi:acetate kinase